MNKISLNSFFGKIKPFFNARDIKPFFHTENTIDVSGSFFRLREQKNERASFHVEIMK